jgi:hypothetical protein
MIPIFGQPQIELSYHDNTTKQLFICGLVSRRSILPVLWCAVVLIDCRDEVCDSHAEDGAPVV